MKPRLILCGVTLALSYSYSYAVKFRHDVPDSEHLNEGAFYENVAKVDTGELIGSGTLIADRWLLTSAHIMADTADNTKVTFENVAGVESTYDVVQQFVHPLFESSSFKPAYDVGLYKLDAPVDGIAAAQLIDPSGVAVSPFTSRFDFAGFGISGPAGPQGVFDGDRRWGENYVEDFMDELGTFLLSGSPVGSPALWVSYFDAPFSIFGASPNEAIAAPGDSGGGWFYNNGGVNTLFALNTFSSFGSVIVDDGIPSSGSIVGLGDPSYGDFMAGVSLDRHYDWIQSTITAVPDSTSTFVLLGVGLFGVAGFRMRKR